MAAATLPEAFHYPEQEYNLMVNEMVNNIEESDRFQSFANYLETPEFKRHSLDIERPRDALILGYAFASAVMIKKNLEMHQRATEALEMFYPSNKVTN